MSNRSAIACRSAGLRPGETNTLEPRRVRDRRSGGSPHGVPVANKRIRT